jgi:hypothetical protein
MSTKNETGAAARDVPKEPKKGWWLNQKIVLLLVACVVIVLALGLGLGLGLGLRKDTANETATLPNTRPSILQDPQEYILDPKWDLTAPNTTRYYVFNITEVPDGNVDGVPKRMYLVNGKYPGPLIEGNEGDRVVVQVRYSYGNVDSQERSQICFPLTPHPSIFMDNSKMVIDAAVPANVRNWFHGRNDRRHSMRNPAEYHIHV